MPNPHSHTHYIDNNEFECLIKRYYQFPDDQVMEWLVRDFFFVLAYHIVVSSHYNWINEEDVIQEAVYDCIKAVVQRRWIPPKKKAFSYFTSVVFNVLRGQYATAKHERDKIDSMTIATGGKMVGGELAIRKLINFRERLGIEPIPPMFQRPNQGKSRTRL